MGNKKKDTVRIFARVEAYTSAAHYLIDHVMRSDDPVLVEEAGVLSKSLLLQVKADKQVLEDE